MGFRGTLLLIGSGDMAERIALGIAASGAVANITIVGRSASVGRLAAVMTSSYDVNVAVEEFDARDVRALTNVIRKANPTLIVQTAALMSPWALAGRSDPLAAALGAAGLAVRMPLQLPVLLATMRAVREADFHGPVANLSLPDLNHPFLHRHGLAPTLGLGNVAMYLLRARAALRREIGPSAEMPLIRVAGQHNHVYDVMQARPRANVNDGPYVWIGEPGERRDELAYVGESMAPSAAYNAVTAAASLPVITALLNGSDLRWSTPAPLGLLGGHPVRLHERHVSLDYPDGVDVETCIAMCAREARGDGFERFDEQGAVHFSEQAHAALASVAPELLEPLVLDDVDRRAARFLSLLNNA
jgi:hypothetical protein